jgi:SNF2 family DNA or RNA helicase
MGGDGTDALDVVNTFKSDPNLRCLITTDKINFGHNIQEAKIIIEWEKPLKPTTSMQRFGRSYRSGQDSDVHAYSFIVNRTIEEIIYDQIQIKKEVIEKVVDELSNGTSTNELDEMMGRLERDILRLFMAS